MTGGRVATLVAGIVLALTGVGVVGGGIAALWAHTTQRDAGGYLAGETIAVDTDTYALTVSNLDLGTRAGSFNWTRWVGQSDVRLVVEPAASSSDVFVGIGARADVDAYLQDVAHDEVRFTTPRGLRFGAWPNAGVELTRTPGGRTPPPPGGETFWAATAEGPGVQELTWQLEPGAWAVAVMNADGTAGLAIEAQPGVASEMLLPIGIGTLILGLVLLAGATALIVSATLAGAGSRPPSDATGHRAGDPGGAASDAYPAKLEGSLDPGLSRGLWLVKWLLAIPHVIALAFLWIAVSVLTVVAAVAILITGRYPRAIFDFNVGVVRWTWRVAYYAYGVLGTDRYPPFTVQPVDYPATFEVVYPARLSRALVLFKALLALPHLVIVAFMTGGFIGWAFDLGTERAWQVGLGGGLIGLLVFVAAIALAATGRYPAGLFDVLMGLNRWVYRVMAYVLLMTDTYPPFRLDTGGTERPPAPEPSDGGPAGRPATTVELVEERIAKG